VKRRTFNFRFSSFIQSTSLSNLGPAGGQKGSSNQSMITTSKNILAQITGELKFCNLSSSVSTVSFPVEGGAIHARAYPYLFNKSSQVPSYCWKWSTESERGFQEG
jgi:hypothetical protein